MLGFKKIKKFVLAFVTTAMLLPAAVGLAKAETKPQVKKQIAAEITEKKRTPFKRFLSRLEFQLDYSNALYLKNPLQKYYEDENNKFKNGDYTFKTPILDWKKFKTPTPTDFGMELSVLYKLGKDDKCPDNSRLQVLGYDLTDIKNLKTGIKKDKNLRIGPVVGFRTSSPRSVYDQTYTLNNLKTPIQREENSSMSTFFLGARGKASLTDKLDLSATVGLNFYKVKGDVYTTLSAPELNYTQYRKADYKGKGTGLSVEVGATYEFRKNIWVGAALGYRTGKVKTKGKEVVTTTRNPEKEYIYDYSPEIDPSGAYGKLIFGLRF